MPVNLWAGQFHDFIRKAVTKLSYCRAAGCPAIGGRVASINDEPPQVSVGVLMIAYRRGQPRPESHMAHALAHDSQQGPKLQGLPVLDSGSTAS